MLLSRCCKTDVVVKETLEESYYQCSSCHLPTSLFSMLVFSDVEEIQNENG